MAAYDCLIIFPGVLLFFLIRSLFSRFFVLKWTIQAIVFLSKRSKMESKEEMSPPCRPDNILHLLEELQRQPKTNLLIGVANTLLLTARRAWQSQINFSQKCWNLEGICWHWNLYGVMRLENLDSRYFVWQADEVVRVGISSVHVHVNSQCNIHLPLENVFVIILNTNDCLFDIAAILVIFLLPNRFTYEVIANLCLQLNGFDISVLFIVQHGSLYYYIFLVG